MTEVYFRIVLHEIESTKSLAAMALLERGGVKSRDAISRDRRSERAGHLAKVCPGSSTGADSEGYMEQRRQRLKGTLPILWRYVMNEPCPLKN